MGVVVLLDERQQGCNDKRHWRTYLVRDVHKELQLGISHLLGMYMLLQPQAVLLLALSHAQIAPCDDSNG